MATFLTVPQTGLCRTGKEQHPCLSPCRGDVRACPGPFLSVLALRDPSQSQGDQAPAAITTLRGDDAHQALCLVLRSPTS